MAGRAGCAGGGKDSEEGADSTQEEDGYGQKRHYMHTDRYHLHMHIALGFEEDGRAPSDGFCFSRGEGGVRPEGPLLPHGEVPEAQLHHDRTFCAGGAGKYVAGYGTDISKSYPESLDDEVPRRCAHDQRSC